MEQLYSTMQVAVERHLWTDAVTLHLRQAYADGRMAYMDNITMREAKEGADLSDITGIKIPAETAQQLMDRLWDVGLRPTEGAGSAGAMAEAQRHIETLKRENERLAAMLQHAMGITAGGEQ